MKISNLRRILFPALACICISSFISCNSGGHDPDVPSEAGFKQPLFEAESALYNILPGTSRLKSIELTASGTYIIVQLPRPKSIVNADKQHITHISTRSYEDTGIISGSYTKKGDGVFELNGFGTIVVKGGEQNAISLDITYKDGSKIEVSAQKAEQYESSPKTNALCRTWVLGKVVDHKPSGDVTYKNILEFYKSKSDFSENMPIPLQVIFTKSGTYIVIYEDGSLSVSTWGWEKEETGQARYSWDYANLYNPLDSDSITIAFEGKQLLVTEEFLWPATYYATEAGN